MIQCEIDTTINLPFPSLINHPHQNSPLTEQDIYDLKNSMRKSNQINDFDDEDDYNEDEPMNNDNQLLTSTQSTTLKTEYINQKSSSLSVFFFLSKFIYLLLLLLFLIQTNK